VKKVNGTNYKDNHIMITALKLLSTALSVKDLAVMKQAKEKADVLIPHMDTTIVPPAPQPQPAPRPVFQPTPFKKHW